MFNINRNVAVKTIQCLCLVLKNCKNSNYVELFTDSISLCFNVSHTQTMVKFDLFNLCAIILLLSFIHFAVIKYNLCCFAFYTILFIYFSFFHFYQKLIWLNKYFYKCLWNLNNSLNRIVIFRLNIIIKFHRIEIYFVLY